MKTQKAYTNRYKVTKNGVQTRKAGQNHFNAKHPRRKELQKHKLVSVPLTSRQKRRFLGGSA